MRNHLRSAVVVITGASSGIGRAAAQAFAKQGSRLVLAARCREKLEEAAEECRAHGVQAVAVPTDVTDESAVKDLAQQAVVQFGRIDVWVNNAAVTVFGRFDETPADDFRRVLETNFFGYVHGARAVLPLFRRQGSGVLLNVASVVGKVGQPYTSAYVASKFAIVGFSKSLRQELAGSRVEVCTVLPASIDTPLFQHGANYSGRAVQPMSPIYDARLVAQTIVETAQRPRPEVFAGAAGRAADALERVAPGLAEKLIGRQVEKEHLRDEPARQSTGNLYQPMSELDQLDGGWRGPRTHSDGLSVTPWLAAVPALALGWYLVNRSR